MAMSRSRWKGPYVHPSLLKKVLRLQEKGSLTKIKTWSRSSTIIPDFVGFTFDVYNGKKFYPVAVTESHVGHKLGEFSPTRTYYGHGADKKSKKGK